MVSSIIIISVLDGDGGIITHYGGGKTSEEYKLESYLLGEKMISYIF